MDQKTLEKLVFEKILSNIDQCYKKLESLDTTIFSNQTYKNILDLLKEKFEFTINFVPSETFFEILLRDKILNKAQREIIITRLITICKNKLPISDLDILIKELKQIKLCKDIAQILSNASTMISPEKIEVAYNYLVEELSKIPNRNASLIKTNSLIEIHESIDKKVDSYFEQTEEKLPTCIKAFDAVTSGFGKTELLTLAALTGGGKSALLLWLSEQYVEKGYNTVLFTLEMSSEEILYRHNAMQSGINITDIQKRRIPKELEGEYFIKLIAANKDKSIRRIFVKECIENNLHKEFDKEKIIKIASKYKNRKSKFHLIEINSNCTPLKIEQEIIKLKNAGNQIDIVVVDFINVMNYDIPIKDRPRELALISRELKLIAKRQKVLVIIGAQLDGGRVKTDGLDADAIKYSKAIVENSDWVIGVERTAEDKALNQIKLKLIKHRHSSPATALLQFDFGTMQCKDLGFANDNEVPAGYDKSGDPLEYVTNDTHKRKNYYGSILSEYNDLFEAEKQKESINTTNESNSQISTKINIPNEDLEMLKKFKEIFPECKIYLTPESNPLFKKIEDEQEI